MLFDIIRHMSTARRQAPWLSQPPAAAVLAGMGKPAGCRRNIRKSEGFSASGQFLQTLGLAFAWIMMNDVTRARKFL
jgi:hypothetical protein